MSKIVLVKNTITSSLKKIQANLDKLPQEAYDFYKAITVLDQVMPEEIPDSTKAVMRYKHSMHMHSDWMRVTASKHPKV